MFSFRGKPTVFGNPECNLDFECPLTEVLQYDPATDKWESLGSLSKQRIAAEIVEVPISFCEYFREPPLPTDEPLDPSEMTAALLVGGYIGQGFGGRLLSDVEIFGCGLDDAGIVVEPLPGPTSRVAGIYIQESPGDLGLVLICGGEVPCPDGSFTCPLVLDDSCFT